MKFQYMDIVVLLNNKEVACETGTISKMIKTTIIDKDKEIKEKVTQWIYLKNI